MKRHLGPIAAALMLVAGAASAQDQPPFRTGVDGTFAPHAMPKLGGGVEGFQIDLFNEVAKRLGLTPAYVRIEFSAMIPGLAAKRWDMINTGIFFTEERSKLMYMVPYEQAAVSFLAARGNPLSISKMCTSKPSPKNLCMKSG